MSATEQPGIVALAGILLGGLITEIGRIIRRRRPRPEREADERRRLDAEWARLDAEKRVLLAEVRDELDECRRRSDQLAAQLRAEQLRVGILIRAMQEAGIAVPDVAMLEVDFDAASGTWRLRDV